MKREKKVLVLLTALFLAGGSIAWAAQAKAPSQASPAKETKAGLETREAKTHQLTGAVSSFTDTSLVISHGPKAKKAETTLVLSPETKKEGTLANGVKVTVFYRAEGNDKVARRVKVHEAKPATETKPAAEEKTAKIKKR